MKKHYIKIPFLTIKFTILTYNIIFTKNQKIHTNTKNNYNTLILPLHPNIRQINPHNKKIPKIFYITI